MERKVELAAGVAGIGDWVDWLEPELCKPAGTSDVKTLQEGHIFNHGEGPFQVTGLEPILNGKTTLIHFIDEFGEEVAINPFWLVQTDPPEEDSGK